MSMRDAISVLTEVSEIIDERIDVLAAGRPESEGYAAELARCITDHEIRVLRVLKDDIGKIKPNNWPTRGLLRRCVHRAVVKACWGLWYDYYHKKRSPNELMRVASLFTVITETREQLVAQGFDAETPKRWQELDSAIIKELKCNSAVFEVRKYQGSGKAQSGLVEFRVGLIEEYAEKNKNWDDQKSVS